MSPTTSVHDVVGLQLEGRPRDGSLVYNIKKAAALCTNLAQQIQFKVHMLEGSVKWQCFVRM